MREISAQLTTTGIEQSPTSLIWIRTNDTAATVTSAGYLSNNLLAGDLGQLSIYEMAVVYTTDAGTILLQVTKSNGVFSLSYPNEISGGVTFSGTLTPGNLTTVSNASGIIQDSGLVANNIMHVNGVNNMAVGGQIKLDKGTGTVSAGAVTINAQSGVIATTALTTAAGTSTTITFNNAQILTTSVVDVFLMGGTNTTLGVQLSATAGSSVSTITISNINASAALNGTLILGFVVA